MALPANRLGKAAVKAPIYPSLLPAVCALCTLLCLPVAAARQGEDAAPDSPPDDAPAAPAAAATDADADPDIEELVVEGYRINPDQLSTRELKAIAGTSGDLLQALDILPGIAVPSADSNGPAEGFYVRGSDLTDNLIRVDLQNLSYLFHFGGLTTISVINPALVEAFDIDLNGFDVANPDRLGGIISAHLRRPANDRLHQQYRVGLLEASFLLEGPISEQDSFWAAGRRSYFDLFVPHLGLDAFEDGEVRIIEFPHYYDVQGRWHRQLPDGFMDATILAAGDRVEVDLRNVEGEDPILIGRLSADISFQSAQYRWHRLLSDNLLQILNLSVLSSEQTFRIGTQQPDDLNPGAPFSLEETNLDFNLKLHWDRSLTGGGLLRYGVDIGRLTGKLRGYLAGILGDDAGVVDSEFSQRRRFSLNDAATTYLLQPYLGADSVLSDRWQLHTGIRLNRYQRDDFQEDFLSPRLRLSYAPAAPYLLEFKAGRHAQLPTDTELSPTFGNPTTLHLQQSQQSALSFVWRPSAQSTLKTELWHKRFDGLVVKPDSLCDRCYENGGEGSATGLDLIWRFSKDDAIGYISYGYIRTRRSNNLNADEFPASGDQPHSLVLAWNQPFAGGSRWSWSVKAGLNSGQPYSRIVGREMEEEEALIDGELMPFTYYYPVYGELNGSRLPAVVDIDLALERVTNTASGHKRIFRLDLLNISSLVYDNVTDYDYGEDYANYASPEGINDQFFVPSFSFEWIF